MYMYMYIYNIYIYIYMNLLISRSNFYCSQRFPEILANNFSKLWLKDIYKSHDLRKDFYTCLSEIQHTYIMRSSKI